MSAVSLNSLASLSNIIAPLRASCITSSAVNTRAFARSAKVNSSLAFLRSFSANFTCFAISFNPSSVWALALFTSTHSASKGTIHSSLVCFASCNSFFVFSNSVCSGSNSSLIITTVSLRNFSRDTSSSALVRLMPVICLANL